MWTLSTSDNGCSVDRAAVSDKSLAKAKWQWELSQNPDQMIKNGRTVRKNRLAKMLKSLNFTHQDVSLL